MSVLVFVHVTLRCLVNVLMTLSDFRRLYQRKAIWREHSRYSVLSIPLKQSDKDILNYNIRLVKYVSRLRTKNNRLLKSIKGHQKIQVRRARGFAFFGGLGIYYFVALNYLPDASDDFLVRFLAASLLFVWPLPIGTIWMLFIYR